MIYITKCLFQRHLEKFTWKLKKIPFSDIHKIFFPFHFIQRWIRIPSTKLAFFTHKCCSYTWGWDGPRTRWWLWCPAVTGAHLQQRPSSPHLPSHYITVQCAILCWLGNNKNIWMQKIFYELYMLWISNMNYLVRVVEQSITVYIKRPELLSLMPEICLFSTKAWIMTKSFDNNGLLLDLQSI